MHGMTRGDVVTEERKNEAIQAEFMRTSEYQVLCLHFYFIILVCNTERRAQNYRLSCAQSFNTLRYDESCHFEKYRWQSYAHSKGCRAVLSIQIDQLVRYSAGGQHARVSEQQCNIGRRRVIAAYA